MLQVFKFDANLFCLPTRYKKHIAEVLIPEGLINDRIKSLASEIAPVIENEVGTTI